MLTQVSFSTSAIKPQPTAQFPQIDFTFLNIVNKNNMIKRLKKRKSLNRYDKFKNNFYQKVQRGYLQISKKNKLKYQVINSNLDIEYNKREIIKSIDRLL